MSAVKTKIVETIEIDVKKLRIARAEKDWTKEELAKRAGVSSRTISRIELERVTRPRGETLEKIAKAWGKEIEYFRKK